MYIHIYIYICIYVYTYQLAAGGARAGAGVNRRRVRDLDNHTAPLSPAGAPHPHGREVAECSAAAAAHRGVHPPSPRVMVGQCAKQPPTRRCRAF